MGAVGFAALYPATGRGRTGLNAAGRGVAPLSPALRSSLPAPLIPAPARPATARQATARQATARQATARQATARQATARQATARPAPVLAGPGLPVPSLPGPTRRSPALRNGAVRDPALRRPALRCGQARARADSAARRRLVMTVLLTTLAVPALVGLATGSTAAWWLAVALLPVVCTYAAVVVRAQRLMAEKEFNVAFLGGTNLGAAGLEDIFASQPGTTGIDQRERRQVSAG